MTTRFYSKTKSAMSAFRDMTLLVTMAYIITLFIIHPRSGFIQRPFLPIAAVTAIYGLFMLKRCVLLPWRQRKLSEHFFQNPTLQRWYTTYMHHQQSVVYRPYSPICRIDKHLELSFESGNLLIPFTITCSPPNSVLAAEFGDYVLAQIADHPMLCKFKLVLMPEKDIFWREEPEE